MKIYIIGFMGSGKSTYGKELAEALGYAFTDLDTDIEKKAGATIPVIFKDKGEDAFRLMEQNALLETKILEDTVIATGGGAPCFFENMEWMNENGLTIYLKLFENELKARIEPVMAERPMLNGIDEDGLEDFIHKTLRKRAFYYHQAKIVIDPNLMNAKALSDVLKEGTFA